MPVQLNITEDLARDVGPTAVTPREFFIAYQGVPTLAYSGFSRGLLDLKRKIEAAIPGLKPENQGSMWPKTTLGALQDGKKLSWEEAYKLRTICSDMGASIQRENWSFEVTHVSLVVFQCRSLEKRIVTHSIELTADALAPSQDQPPDYHLAFVDQIMAQFREDQLLAYLPALQKDGNRISDYRKDHVEATLVCDLPAKQPSYLREFTQRVDRELPGLYEWFLPESRHMTVRALVSGE